INHICVEKTILIFKWIYTIRLDFNIVIITTTYTDGHQPGDKKVYFCIFLFSLFIYDEFPVHYHHLTNSSETFSTLIMGSAKKKLDYRKKFSLHYNETH